MSQFNTLQSITSRLKELSDQLSSSRLSQEELEEFETLSRKLYEITIIINYKAKEEVFKTRTPKKQEPIEVKEEPKKEYKESKEEVKPVANKIEERETSSPGLVEFDFSGGQPSEEVESKSVQKEEAPVENVAPREIKQEIHSPERPVKHIEEEDNVTQDEVVAFYQHFSITYQEALKDKLSNAKIHSIKSAIGLNDKLQFISELFAGNSDAFNQIVEELDQLEDNEVALQRLSIIAAEKKWNKEAEVVDQFVNIVNRRYVE